MANRAIAAKTLKMKKQRRLFPKQYQANYIPVGRGPNQEVMAGYKERTRGLAFDQKYLDFLELHARFKGKSPGRVEVEAAIRRIEEFVPQQMYFTVIKNCVQWCRVYFNSQHTLYILLHENYKNGTVRTSMSYSDKDRIISAWNTDRIRWVECKALSPKEPSAEASAPPLRTG